MSIEQRLREYSHWYRDEPLDVSLGESIFGRIQREQLNAGARGEGSRYDSFMVDGESVTCRPDGGMGRMADRIGAQLARDNRCREIRDLLPFMPRNHAEVMKVVYLGPEARTARASAELLRVSLGQFQERKAALHAWFEGAMFRSMGLGRAAAG
jgi:hypothetical protein